MPFVPIGSRTSKHVILDHEKVDFTRKQQARDQAKINYHVGAMPSNAGYRFGNHPETRGQTRGPDVPFRGATSSWRPTSADPNGPAAQRDQEQAEVGAIWSESHKLRTVRSSPDLQSSASKMLDNQACHPLSTELRRWTTLANVTQSSMHGIEVPERKSPTARPRFEEEEQKGLQGLVNFPKYMLINNCHLKTMDVQRFQKLQAEEKRRQEEMEAEAVNAFRPGRTGDTLDTLEDDSAVPWQKPSWGAPLLKKPGHHWAGSSMASGRSMRTSNCFRS